MSRMALELSQTLTNKRLSHAVEALIAVHPFERVKLDPRARHFRKINRENCFGFGGDAIAMLND